ncbi:hypothetical protein [Janibacter sp. GXQ6167]|uniref:hypothetical protein n=1 Tax=Janibacter sp. GXQ6167 TaxID=3240791 RepID=UPI003526278A
MTISPFARTRVVDRFTGRILGVGSRSGVRIVVGRWDESPLGAFADVMLADASGTRWLLAPSEEVADYVAQTYHFDRVVIAPMTVQEGGRGASWRVRAGALDTGPGDDGALLGQALASGLDVQLTLGQRSGLGLLLRCVPRRLATSRLMATLADPIARLTQPGVRTRGTAGNGRREYYGATDQHLVTGVDGTWQGADLGGIAPVDPAPDFGFSSTPRVPSCVSVTTTVTRPIRPTGDGRRDDSPVSPPAAATVRLALVGVATLGILLVARRFVMRRRRRVG